MTTLTCTTRNEDGSNSNSNNNNSSNLILSPSQHESFAELWDIRIGNGDTSGSDQDVSKWRDEGMLISLALSNSPRGGQTFIACGMESGRIFFHDLRMIGRSRCTYKVHSNDIIESNSCSVSLGKDPILCLDMCPSKNEGGGDGGQEMTSRESKDEKTNNDDHHESIITIAGKAADAIELLNLPEQERGTVSVIKTTATTNSTATTTTTHNQNNGRMKASV